MVTTVDGLLALGALGGAVLWWAGYRVATLSSQLGRRAFLAFVLTLGSGCVVAGVGGLVPGAVPPGPNQSSWEQVPLLFWLASTLPWFVFTLQYTGTRTRISARTVALLGAPYVLLFVQIGLTLVDSGLVVLNVLGSAAFVYAISLVVGGAVLLLQAVRSSGHVSLAQGVSLVAVSVGSLVVWNVISTPSGTPMLPRTAAYTAGSALSALGVGAALVRYDLFDAAPSVDTLGDRALIRETDDLMLVVDADDELITINDPAVETLGVTRSTVLGDPLADVLGHTSEALTAAETVTVRTADGARQYDPQVSAVRDHHGNDLGATLSLRDVTDRRLREERLAVLNRVLRHNLRNEADVVMSHTEALDGADPEHTDAIVDAAESIASLGEQARRIDRVVSEPDADTRFDLVNVLRSTRDTVDAASATVSVSLDVPDAAPLVTNRRAVETALESALDNALTYADSAVSVTVASRDTGYTVTVADDGPGIPEWELDSLDVGTESPLDHTTGLGLWQLKWAVVVLNGDLSFDTDDGTTVEFHVPDRATTTATT